MYVYVLNRLLIMWTRRHYHIYKGQLIDVNIIIFQFKWCGGGWHPPEIEQRV